MTTGREIRSRIDSEQVRGLLLINGGAAVALIALIPYVLDKPEFIALSRGIFLALFLFQLGLVFAVIHNRQRRKCALEYEEAEVNPSNWPGSCRFLWWEANEPCICMRSIAFMWASVACFVFGGLTVATSGFLAVG